MLKTKIKRLVSRQRLLAVCALILLVVVSRHQPIDAQQAFTQGYKSDVGLQRGMIVQLTENDSSKVEPVSISSIERMHGVVVDPNDAPVTLSTDEEKVFVATAGRYEVLVSDQNGHIKPGDYITISALSGTGMRAGSGQPSVVGRAVATFDGQSRTVSTATIMDQNNQAKTVKLGRVEADILVARNPHFNSVNQNVSGWLSRTSESIAGKPVSTIRIYLSAAIFLISTILPGALMYGAIRSAITAIGRNPLSKRSIIKGMIQVILTGLTIFIAGLFAVYLILKL